MPDDPLERLRAADPGDPFDPLDPLDPLGGAELVRPRPGHPVIVRLRERAEPWVAWLGLRRLLLTAVTVVAVVAAGWWLLRAPSPPTEAGLPHAAAATRASLPAVGNAASTTAGTTTTSPPGLVVVHVAGAVAAPGVYELPADARTADAVMAAGGPTAAAQVDALNLAAPLQDGVRVYVPVEGEPVPVAAVPAAGPPGTAPVGPVDVNRATVDELDALPGIGPSTASAIVSHRETNGPFASVDDLEQVRGIGPAKLETIRPLVST